MTKKQREDFESALRSIEQSAFTPDPRAIAKALSILSSRLDDIESLARVARYEAKGC